MTLVAGIGDEVVTVAITLLVLLVVSLVWSSTRVRDRPQIIAATFTVHRDSSSHTSSQPNSSVNEGGGDQADAVEGSNY